MKPTDDEILAVLLTWRERIKSSITAAPDQAACDGLRGMFGRGDYEVRTERLETARLLLAAYRSNPSEEYRNWDILEALVDADELIAAIDAKGPADET
jgi:hypothetical protein